MLPFYKAIVTRQVLLNRSYVAIYATQGRMLSLIPARLLHTGIEYKASGADRSQIAHLSFSGDKKFPIASRDAMQALLTELNSIGNQKNVIAVLIRSTFVGADLDGLKCLQGPRDARDFIQMVDSLCSQIQDFRVPVVSFIDGPCMGAGMEVAAACDLRYATSNATFAMPETKLVSVWPSFTDERGLKT